MSQPEHGQVLDAIDRVEVSIHDLNATVKEMNGRLRSLELWKARMEGVAAAHRWLMPIAASISSALISSGLLILLTAGAHHAH